MLIIKTLYTMTRFIDILLITYILLSWLFRKNRFTKQLYVLLSPILEPLKAGLKRSAINTSMIDFSPIIALIILSFIEQLCVKFI